MLEKSCWNINIRKKQEKINRIKKNIYIAIGINYYYWYIAEATSDANTEQNPALWGWGGKILRINEVSTQEVKERERKRERGKNNQIN